MMYAHLNLKQRLLFSTNEIMEQGNSTLIYIVDEVANKIKDFTFVAVNEKYDTAKITEWALNAMRNSNYAETVYIRTNKINNDMLATTKIFRMMNINALINGMPLSLL